MRARALSRSVVHLLAVAAAIASTSGDATAQEPRDALVQPPTFKQPERGSLVGSLAKFAIGAEDVSRGSFALGLPIEIPTERGSLLAAVFPSYAPENGISEWGIGWSAGLAIQRFRLAGDVDYQTDGFTSPWGRLEQGSDGFYYPSGLEPPIRIERRTDGWVATDPAGTRHEFLRAVQTPEGPYAWYLTKVETIFGDAADLQYQASAGGRPFVTVVRYGGRESPQTYRLNFEYDTLPAPLLDFRAGYPLALDRRVKGVVAWAKENGSGTYRRRWRYDISYRDSAFGPGFHLDSLVRTYVSGETEPPISYDYDLPEQSTPAGLSFRTGEIEDAPSIQAFLDQSGDPEAIQPDHSAVTDRDDDGLPDLEHAFDFTLFRQSASGAFVAEPLPPPPGGTDPACRPGDSIFNEARAVLRMAGAGTDLQILVLDALSSTTNIRVCDRSGIPQFDVDVPGRWTLGANMKVVDVNRDEKPDLLLVDTGTYAVLENISGQGCGSGGTCVPFGFQAHPPVELAYSNGFPFTPSASWSHDMNGDGNPDLVQRTDDRMSIWYGRGRFRVDDTERQLAVLNRDGNELLNLNDWEVSWIDANKDGLADALMTFDGEPTLFINEADHFQEVVAPVLEESIFLDLGPPIAGDLRARGDLDLVFLGNADASAVALTVPSSGLMVGSDDGKGTQVTFDYERAAAAPGLRQRPAVLRSLTVATAGYDEITSEYTYAAPAMHTVGHFLIGFGNVGAAGPLTSEQVDFHHDDQIAAQVDASVLFDDRTPGLMKFSHTAYEEAVHSGVRVRRGKTSRAGWCAGTDVAACIAGSSPAAFETTEFLTYESGICPTEVRQTNRHGQLLTESTLAAPAQLSGALHCISDAQTWTGAHADASRNFLLATKLTINDRSQVTQVEQLGGGESLILQDITYDPITHRVASVSAPGEGTQTFAYDAATGQLEQVTSADGVVSSAQNRSPTTDALLELVGDRGPGGVLTSSFRYDGMERLAKRWTDFGGSSETGPLEAIDYQFPTTDFPGLIQVSGLIDAAAGTRQETAAWTYPDGAALASATRIPGRWVFGAVSSASRSELRASTSRRAPLLDPADVALESYGSLLSSTTLLGETTTAGFGHLVSSRNLVQQGVERGVADTLSLNESNLLVTASRENDTFETRRAVDASGRVVWMRNQASGITRYDYDAIGRVVGLSLVDGTRHRLNFDAFGRPDQVVRDGVGTVSYTYDPTTGLLVFKDHIDADGVLERTVEVVYDGVGRVVERLHVQPESGDESAFSFRYDGDVGDGEVLGGQKGYTTRIEGPAYALTAVRNPDGSEESSSLTLAEWMQVDVTSTYHASGSVKELHRTITRLSDGVVIDDVTTGHAYDAWGRLERIDVNGAALATLNYDDDGRVAWVDLPDGQRVDHFYDPATHRPSGYAHQAIGQSGAWESGVQWTFNARGLVASETIDLGEDSWLRSYGYDSRGYLTRSEDPAQLATYSYMPAGLPDQITDERGTRTVFRGSARAITVAGIPYEYDASGRVTARGGTTFSYGPDGHLAEARAGTRTLAYRYDADGNRILKYEDGSPTAAFLGGGYLTGDGFIAPVEIAGRLVGVLEGGTFHLLATDPRGTPLADRDGTPRPVSPYGVRITRPDLSAALDYVEKGFDADLESVRMGVRDYDPLISQFRTPDPLFLESLEQCSASPVECNLFTYAANNPVSLRDPTGEVAWFVGVVVVWWLLENEGTANAPDHDDVAIPRPTVMDDVKGTAKVVVGAAGGAAGATLGKVGTNLVTRTVFAGAGGGAVAAGGTRAVDDAFRGELSSPGEYASDMANGAVAGVLLSPLGMLPGRARQMGPTRQDLGIDDAVKPAAPAAQAPALRLVNGRRPINWRYAGKTHPSGVRFTAEGFPDFNPYAVARTRLPGLTGKYKVDAARANKAVGLAETPDRMVWHHLEDGETMLLIPKVIHSAVRHTGGSAIIRSRR